MTGPHTPDDEDARSAALAALNILDSDAEPAFDRITQLARALSGADMAVVSLLDDQRQWFKSRAGLDVCQTPRDQAFCAHAVLSERTLWVEDARQDPRFRENPLVTGAPFIRFYAGAPISSGGVRLGTLCVFDPRPQAYDAAFDAQLRSLAAMVDELLELRRLRHTTRLAEEIARTTTDAIVSADADGLVTTWNQGAEALFGHRAEEVVGRPLLVIIPERMRARHEAGFARACAGGERRLGSVVEVPALHKDGTEFPVELSLAVWGQGAQTGVAAIIRDVRTRKQQEAATADAKRRADDAQQAAEAARHVVHDVVQHAPVPLVMTDRDLRVLQVSGRWREHYGMQVAQVLGRTMHDIFPAGREHWGPVYDRALAGEGSRGERAATSQAGVERWFHWEAAPWREASGEVGGLLLMNVDVTDLVRAKEAAARARDAAEASDRTKSAFLANMSHEIRTPLNGVLGEAGALAATTLDPLQQQMLRLIENSAQGLSTMLTGALELAAASGDQAAVRREPVDLPALLRAVHAEFEPGAAGKGLHLTLETSGPPAVCWSDRALLHRILTELVGNAVRFTVEGRVVLRLKLEEAGNALRVRFEVQDTGPGFDMADRDRLFGSFQQADESTTRSHGGAGLGLAVARALAGRLGGELDAVAEPGRGALFSLTLALEPATGSIAA